LSVGIAAARRRGGLVGQVQRLTLTAAAAATFVRLYLLPAKGNPLPKQVRLQPAW
jgi:magnesium-protoporphyrin IX monomethyl ester (oxidative) cyclase